METISASDVAETATALRAVLDAVDAGELDAELYERDYLRGAIDTLETLSRAAA